MTKKDLVSEAGKILDYYILCYKTAHTKNPSTNRYRDKWGFVDVLTDVGSDRAKELLDFYFRIPRNHDLKWFFLHYDELDESEKAIAKDRAEREAIRAQTRKRVELSEQQRTETD